jgi:hypothetical protein
MNNHTHSLTPSKPSKPRVYYRAYGQILLPFFDVPNPYIWARYTGWYVDTNTARQIGPFIDPNAAIRVIPTLPNTPRADQPLDALCKRAYRE